MKYLSSNFQEYILEYKKYNLHKNLLPLFKSLNNNHTKHNNLIFYGPPGVGKYTQVLNYIKKYSATNLRFERKIIFNFTNKKQYIFNVSDIHFELDMSLLGCHAKLLFNDIYYHILDILSARTNRTGIIVCKNFHYIHSELLDIFYSYMQTLEYKNINIFYILITEHISFIPKKILNRCQIIPFKRPTKSNYIKITSKKLLENISSMNQIINIKDVKSKVKNIIKINNKICDKILNYIKNYKNINFLDLRDTLYEIFIYNLNIYTCLNYIIYNLVNENYINDKNIYNILLYLFKFLKLYNNNYRPIYHLERFIFYLCIEIHEL